VIAPDGERAALAGADKLVHCQCDPVALAQAEPADARGEALERDSLARELDPASE
jgi:hypothetical protein